MWIKLQNNETGALMKIGPFKHPWKIACQCNPHPSMKICQDYFLSHAEHFNNIPSINQLTDQNLK